MPSGRRAVVASARLRKKWVISAFLVPRCQREEHARVIAPAFDGFGDVKICTDLGPAEADAAADRAAIENVGGEEIRLVVAGRAWCGEPSRLGGGYRAGWARRAPRTC